MKTTFAALAFAAFALSGFANAATNAADQPAAMQTQQVKAKTRADVRHELIQAQMNGQIAGLQNLYRGS
jgi:outer membrane lipoprotein SlyB